MPIACPTCFKINPANAAYCFYDGRALSTATQQTPLGVGTMPFPVPFSFSDGLGCLNFNQLVLACDHRWNLARSYLANGTWQSFFSAIERPDLAALAIQSAREADADIGLCRLLEGLPADPEALRPAKLALTTTVEDLGSLEPGKDYKFNLVLENHGLLLLRGSIATDCDWLDFGDHQGTTSAKLFQTRDAYTLPVRVMGNNLHAGNKPLEGLIIVDTNGGCQAVTVRAAVPIHPFPRGGGASNVLAGALSPRDVAVKARENPKEAAALFEQGAVKAWYARNGWTYPVQGSQARGQGAVQQFFEALGLTRPPRLEIDTERITCKGEAGKHLTETVTIRTAEAKIVHAAARSDKRWVKVLPARSQGNSVTIPLRIDIPPRPGETLHATVTVQGNGQQQFVVPVTLTVAGTTPEQEEKRERRGRRLEWIAGGIGLFLFFVIAGSILSRILAPQPSPDPTNQAQNGGVPEKPVPRGDIWWDKFPDNHLAESVTKLRAVVGDNGSIFDSLEVAPDVARKDGYKQLAKRLADLERDPAAKEPLGQFVAECCVYEPRDDYLQPLLEGLATQFPRKDRAFPADDKGEAVERVSFWFGVVCKVIDHEFTKSIRRQDLARALAQNLKNLDDLEPDTPPEELKDQVEKALAEQCYYNLVPTAEKSLEQALTIRKALTDKFQSHPGKEFRHQHDVPLLAMGLSEGKKLWSKLKPLFEACAESNEIGVGNKLIGFYEDDREGLAPEMEAILVDTWKVTVKPGWLPSVKVDAIRKGMEANARAAKISETERVKQLQQAEKKRLQEKENEKRDREAREAKERRDREMDEKRERDEIEASKSLERAKKLHQEIDVHKNDNALEERKLLRKIVEKWSDTKAAAEAKNLLPPAKSAKEVEDEEDYVRDTIKLCNNRIDQGFPEVARERLERILKDYPENKWAPKAKELLKKLNDGKNDK
jgi:hypothetical protein